MSTRPNLELGSPLTLTWSIVPDNLALSSFSAHPSNPNPTSDLIVRLDEMWSVPIGDRSTDLTQRPWFAAIQSQFDIYASKTGLSYQYVVDDGAPIGFPGKTTSPTRGDIRFAVLWDTIAFRTTATWCSIHSVTFSPTRTP